jgi:hypothetical protein
VELIFCDQANGELSLDLLISKNSRHSLWQTLSEFDADQLVRSQVLKAIKLYRFQNSQSTMVADTNDIFLYDRLSNYQLLRGGTQQLPFNNEAALVVLGRQYPLTTELVKNNNNANPIMRLLATMMD